MAVLIIQEIEKWNIQTSRRRSDLAFVELIRLCQKKNLMIYFVICFRADCDVIRSETLWDEQQSKLGRKSRSLYALKKGKGFSGGGGRVTFFHAAFKESISDEERRDLTVAAALTSMGGLYTARAIASSPLRQKKREKRKKNTYKGKLPQPFFSQPPRRERVRGSLLGRDTQRAQSPIHINTVSSCMDYHIWSVCVITIGEHSEGVEKYVSVADGGG